MFFYKSRLDALLKLLQNKSVRCEIQKAALPAIDANKLLQLLQDEAVRQEIQEVALSSAIGADSASSQLLQLLQNGTVRQEIRKAALSAIDANQTQDKFLQMLQDEAVRQKIKDIALEGINVKAPMEANSLPLPERVPDSAKEICVAQEAYELYRSLPQSLRDELRNVINDTNVMTFVVSGCIEHNLEVLWDCCRRAIICGKLSVKDIDCLIGVFEYYFDILNSSIRDGKYEYLKVDVGDDFKEDVAQRMPDNPAQGRIDKVMLQGFRYIGGKVVKRSLVKIEEEAI